MIRVAIAEEQRIARWALGQALARTGEIEVVGEAATVKETVAMVRTAEPDVLVLDTTMPDHSGFDVLHRIRELEKGPLVVVLAPLDDPGYAVRTIAAGAHAYVSMSEEPARLLGAIRAVVAGERFVPPEVEQRLAAGIKDPASALTARELEVMELLARGMTNREIGEQLAISIKTVDTHRGHLLKKLRLRNNSDLTRFALRHGYVTA